VREDEWWVEEYLPNASIISGIESNAGCAGAGFESPFAWLPLTAGLPLVSAGILEVCVRSMLFQLVCLALMALRYVERSSSVQSQSKVVQSHSL
jgi:hypothetical protein